MSIFHWFIDIFGKKSKRKHNISEIHEEVEPYAQSFYAYQVSFYLCISKIANALSRCEFKTYVDGAEKKEEDYYRLNFQPNKNQSTSVFLSKLVTKLYENNECVVVEIGDELFVADSYSKVEYVLYDTVFSNVTIQDLTLERTFLQSDVFYFKLNNHNLPSYLFLFNSTYEQLLDHAVRSYKKSRGTKGILYVDQFSSGDEDFQQVYERIVNEDFSKYFRGTDAVLPLFDGFKFEESKGAGLENTRDIKNLIDDILDYTAKTLMIPLELVRGNISDVDNVLNEFLTYCIDPLCRILEKEMSRKLYKKDVLRGCYIKIDTSVIRHMDLLSNSVQIDKLISCGVCCVNDVLKMFGLEAIDAPWANEHFVTKNYEKMIHEKRGEED